VRHGYTDYGASPIRLHDGLLTGNRNGKPGLRAGEPRMHPMIRHPRHGTPGRPARGYIR